MGRTDQSTVAVALPNSNFPLRWVAGFGRRDGIWRNERRLPTPPHLTLSICFSSATSCRMMASRSCCTSACCSCHLQLLADAISSCCRTSTAAKAGTEKAAAARCGSGTSLTQGSLHQYVRPQVAITRREEEKKVKKEHFIITTSEVNCETKTPCRQENEPPKITLF